MFGVLRWYWCSVRSLSFGIAQFIRTDVLLACVREERARTHCHKHHHPQPTVGSPEHLAYPLCTVRRVHLAQSINPEDSFHTSYHWPRGLLREAVFLHHSRISPIPHIRVWTTLFEGLTQAHTHARPRSWISNPTTSFQGSTASQLFLATTTRLVLSLLLCVSPHNASDTGSLNENR